MIYKSTNVTAEIASSIIAKELKNSGVPTMPLKNICSLVTDGEHQTPERSFLGVPLLTAKNVRDDYIDLTETDFVTDDVAEKCWRRCRPQINDILMTCVGTIGRIAVVKKPLDAVLVRSVAILRPRLDVVLPDYLAGMLNSFQIKQEMQSQIRESAQPGLYLSQIKMLEVPIPDIVTQTLIANFINWCRSPNRQEMQPPPLPQKIGFVQYAIEQVDKLVAKIEEARGLRSEAGKELHSLKSSYMNYLFNTAIFQRWPSFKLDEIADIRAGVTLGRILNRSAISVPYLRVANVQDGHLDLRIIKEVNILPEELEKWRLKDGDILLTEGGDWDKLGRGTVWKGEIPDCIHQNHIFRVRITQKDFDVHFLSAYLSSPYGKAYFQSASKQTTNLASINQKQLRAFTIPKPPLDIQKDMVMSLSMLQKKIDLLKQQQIQTSAELNALLPSILDKAFKGEL